VTAEIGCEKAQTRELARVPLGAAQCQVSPERDTADPHLAAEGAGWQQNLLAQPCEYAALDDLLQLKAREHQIDRE